MTCTLSIPAAAGDCGIPRGMLEAPGQRPSNHARNNMSKTALVIIADGIEEIEAITPGDVLARAGVNVTVAGVGSLTPIGGHNIPMRAEMLVEDVGEILFDAIVIPGGGKGARRTCTSRSG